MSHEILELVSEYYFEAILIALVVLLAVVIEYIEQVDARTQINEDDLLVLSVLHGKAMTIDTLTDEVRHLSEGQLIVENPDVKRILEKLMRQGVVRIFNKQYRPLHYTIVHGAVPEDWFLPEEPPEELDNERVLRFIFGERSRNGHPLKSVGN